MRELSCRLIPAVILCCLALSPAMQAQSDPAKLFKTNCTLCHGADGSGDNPTGKAFHAKDLRSAEVQKQTDAELAALITKGKGKMPALRAKINPDHVTKWFTSLPTLPNK